MDISGIAELIYYKFTRKTCLVPCLDEFEGQGHHGQKRGQCQSYRGQKIAFFGPFGGLRAGLCLVKRL